MQKRSNFNNKCFRLTDRNIMWGVTKPESFAAKYDFYRIMQYRQVLNFSSLHKLSLTHITVSVSSICKCFCPDLTKSYRCADADDNKERATIVYSLYQPITL